MGSSVLSSSMESVFLRRRGVCGERDGEGRGSVRRGQPQRPGIALSLLAPICNLRSPPRGRDVENWRSAARLRGAGVWRVARATTCEEMLSCERWRGDSDGPSHAACAHVFCVSALRERSGERVGEQLAVGTSSEQRGGAFLSRQFLRMKILIHERAAAETLRLSLRSASNRPLLHAPVPHQ